MEMNKIYVNISSYKTINEFLVDDDVASDYCYFKTLEITFDNDMSVYVKIPMGVDEGTQLDYLKKELKNDLRLANYEISFNWSIKQLNKFFKYLNE